MIQAYLVLVVYRTKWLLAIVGEDTQPCQPCQSVVTCTNEQHVKNWYRQYYFSYMYIKKIQNFNFRTKCHSKIYTV